MKSVTLDLERVAAEAIIPDVELTSAGIAHAEVVTMGTLRGLAVRLQGYVATEHVTREPVVITHSEPAGWWQHFKSQHRYRWWMRWLVRRRPVRVHEHEWTVELDDRWVYPEAWKRLGVPVKNRKVQVAYQLDGVDIGLDILAPGM